MSRRSEWQAAVRSDHFPAGLRVVRGTLLLLVPLMRATGEVVRSEDEMLDATGLPRRTLQRHLARAVEAGWLTFRVRGGNGRAARYDAAIPDSCVPQVADNYEKLCATSYAQLPDSCAPPGGGLNKNYANASELLALNTDRERRNDHERQSGVERASAQQPEEHEHRGANSAPPTQHKEPEPHREEQQSASASEHVAVEPDRERRTDHDDSRVSPKRDERTSGIEERTQNNLVRVPALASDAGGAVDLALDVAVDLAVDLDCEPAPAGSVTGLGSADDSDSVVAAAGEDLLTLMTSTSAEHRRESGNPKCRECGRRVLYSPETIRRGTCARCSAVSSEGSAR